MSSSHLSLLHNSTKITKIKHLSVVLYKVIVRCAKEELFFQSLKMGFVNFEVAIEHWCSQFYGVLVI
ncbi:hypothetical protein PIB30_080153 [Stylosanthes scabra]|uniref:Uncharacterized protein n=1 Tax=Stylosanthes scabra TaxID=79078 RepID=A0ABU6YQE8_9FABA|nr:hypothetical protein [Stylosanthes scabra]